MKGQEPDANAVFVDKFEGQVCENLRLKQGGLSKLKVLCACCKGKDYLKGNGAEDPVDCITRMLSDSTAANSYAKLVIQDLRKEADIWERFGS